MKNITVCLLAHKETPLLSQVSKSIAWAETVLILDNESNIDWNRYFPHASSLKVIQVAQPIDDFAAVRNSALKSCETDWIFFIDSDEVLQTGAEMEFLRVMKSDAVGGVVTRSDIFQGTQLAFGEAGSQQLVRLCKVAETQYRGAVHEVPVLHGSLIHTSVQLHHYAHESITEFIESVSAYAQLAATEERFAQMSSTQIILQLSCFPLLKFLQNYLLRAGFRDGYAGLVYAYCMSLHSLLVRLYAYERYKSHTAS